MLNMQQKGFTVVELVVVMLLMAVISAVGMSRFASREPFAVQGVADQLVSGLRLAQATALAQRRTVYLQLGATPASLAVCLDAGCTQPLTPPGGGTWLVETQNVQLAASLSFSIDPAGAPSFATPQTVQVSSSGGSNPAQPIVIEPGSGHVHSP
jgi:MSHA pilin protein MshC